MSDPVTNVEIEDVLSSIRRLVSAEARPDQSEEFGADDTGGNDATGHAARSTRQEPRLVLTPGQRVDAGKADQDDETGSVSAAQQPDSETADAQQTSTPQHQVADDNSLADLEAALAHSDADLVQQPDPFDNVEEAVLLDAAYEDEDADLSAGDEEAIPEFLSNRRDEGNRPQDASQDEAAQPPATAEDEHEEAPFADMRAQPAEQQDDGLEVTSELVDSGATLHELAARAASVEETVQENGAEWEPDVTANAPLIGDAVEPLPWHSIEAETADAQQPEPTEEAASAPRETVSDDDEAGEKDAWFDNSEAVLDEDALRDMVGEIVRQELQGVLGERITRNVRKLVRREIQRALSTQGIE